jgi:hypothetical protein
MTSEIIQDFDELLKLLHDEGLLPYITIIGSWAEHIYKESGVIPNYDRTVYTRDIDLLFPTKNSEKIPSSEIVKKLEESGYVYDVHRETEAVKFYTEKLELEFLVPETGREYEKSYKLQTLNNLRAQAVREVSILINYNKAVVYNGLKVNVPWTSAYVIQKLLINEKRASPAKKQKDIQSIRYILDLMEDDATFNEEFGTIFSRLKPKKQKRIKKTCIQNSINLGSIIG